MGGVTGISSSSQFGQQHEVFCLHCAVLCTGACPSRYKEACTCLRCPLSLLPLAASGRPLSPRGPLSLANMALGTLSAKKSLPPPPVARRSNPPCNATNFPMQQGGGNKSEPWVWSISSKPFQYIDAVQKGHHAVSYKGESIATRRLILTQIPANLSSRPSNRPPPSLDVFSSANGAQAGRGRPGPWDWVTRPGGRGVSSTRERGGGGGRGGRLSAGRAGGDGEDRGDAVRKLGDVDKQRPPRPLAPATGCPDGLDDNVDSSSSAQP